MYNVDKKNWKSLMETNITPPHALDDIMTPNGLNSGSG